MNGLAEGIQNAINYIEQNLTEELNINDIAKKAYLSPFYFQKIFGVLCGFSVFEYIRMRRLTLAAEELSYSDKKVIDIALKYGYNSPDSFTRAFTKFHGVSPSASSKSGASLKNFAPLKIKLTLKGGTIMEYRIVEKAAFTVMGKVRRFNIDTAYEEIPKFWTEHCQSEDAKLICGMYGVCIDSDGKNFDYIIADNYIPQNDIPKGFVTRTIPSGTWAVFPCRGPMPKSIQDVNTQIWSEWLVSCKEYKFTGNYSIEMYTPITKNPEDNYSEIWIPVKKA